MLTVRLMFRNIFEDALLLVHKYCMSTFSGFEKEMFKHTMATEMGKKLI